VSAADPTPPLAGILVGPTAAGKTALAVALSARLPIEVVSADSRQVYRGLDIGTAKPSAAEQQAVRHHLLDRLDLHETYNAARFADDALRAAEDIRRRGKIPLVVGGAGFYVRVLETGLFDPPYDAASLAAIRADLAAWDTEALHTALAERDPQRAAAIHANDRYRLARALEICIAAGRSVTELTAAHRVPERRFVKFRLVCERSELHARIAHRAEAMLSAGWIEEAQAALAYGARADAPGLRSLGYPHVLEYLAGRCSRERLLELVVRDTRRFARAQETWFRKAHDAIAITAADNTAVESMSVVLQRAFATT
jgi:tRNA dimethylallyltransferase